MTATDENPHAAWRAVDEYLNETVRIEDETSREVLAANHAAGLPSIDVAPNQGKLLHLIASLSGARRVLEFGTLGGYSTIWLARALPAGGKVVTLEASVEHAEVARRNFAVAGLADMIDLRVGAALDTLPGLAAEPNDPFDLVFIDADKPNNPAYLDWALRLTRPGGVIVGDNVVRDGRVLDTSGEDPAVVGTRSLLELFGRDPRLESTAVQTVGAKGWDGFAIARVL